ncbi:hypothetical protein BY996DRAFT_6432850 [Phakopsora pachyrhizi]|nr:hypothetical protein BY996DRAFT_6432850 [Phakopsora pachyrhizi]
MDDPELKPDESGTNSTVQVDPQSADEILNQLSNLISELQSNPFDYNSHKLNIELCKKLGIEMVEELNQARNLMSDYFPADQDFFSDWISDLKSFGNSPYDLNMIQSVLKVYEQASSYSFFPTIEASRLDFIIQLYYDSRLMKRPNEDLLELVEGNSDEASIELGENDNQISEEMLQVQDFVNEEMVRELAVDVIDKVGHHLCESSKIWNLWAVHEFTVFKKDPTEDRLSRFKAMLHSRLGVPHLDSANTFQVYSTLITKHENDHYEEEMVAANAIYCSARKLTDDREIREAQLKKSGYSCEEYLKYLSWEVSRKPIEFDLCYVLFERALLQHPNTPELWTEFLRFLTQCRDQPMLPITIARRATRTIPWCGDIWAGAIRAFERNGQSIEVVEDLCSRAINSKFLEHDAEALVAFTIGRADFHRRRLDAYISAGGFENLEQVLALVEGVAKPLLNGIEKLKKLFPRSGDPSCRLEKYLVTLYEHHDRADEASKVWEKTTKRYRETYSTWISAADFEVRRKNLGRAREYFKKAANIKLDYPEYLLQAWLAFEHHFGNLDELEHATFKVNNIMKGINARRKRASVDHFIHSTDQTSNPADKEVNDDNQYYQAPTSDAKSVDLKRKAEEALGKDEPTLINVNAGAEQSQASNSLGEKNISDLKRDRENSTVLLAGLQPDITESKISQLFRDCGKIREIVIHRVDSSEVVATVEFWDRDSVLPAQTKDKKQLDGQEISVTLAWRSTLYVTNFSEDAKDDWIREKFSRYGKIFDVRWPSKRFKSTRRFCYVQFTSPESAESALELHELEVAPQQKMSVLISNPARKQSRTDVGANDRELYITCLSKFVQENDLRKLFSPFGEITGVRLMLDSAGHSKGFAFVEFKDESSAKAALSVNNVELKKRRIGVTISSGKGQLLSKRSSASAEKKISSLVSHRSRSVKVSNLPEGFQEALVQQAFETFGKVIKIITYPDKKEALVEFESEKDSGKVMLDPNPIYVNEQKVEVSVPISGTANDGTKGSGSSESFVPLLPRKAAIKGQRSRLGIGSKKNEKTELIRSDSERRHKKIDVDIEDKEATTNKKSKNDAGLNKIEKSDGSGSDNYGGKGQDEFRKMLLK